MAISLDGFIAHLDGSAEGFLWEGQHVTDYLESLKEYDTAIMGRKTYESGYQFGMKPGANPYPHMRTLVFSSRLHLPEGADQGIECIGQEFIPSVQKLKDGPGKPIYLCGGGEFAGLLMQHDLVDRLILKLNPVTFGNGIPLWRCAQSAIRSWSLKQQMAYGNGLLLLEYVRN